VKLVPAWQASRSCTTRRGTVRRTSCPSPSGPTCAGSRRAGRRAGCPPRLRGWSCRDDELDDAPERKDTDDLAETCRHGAMAMSHPTVSKGDGGVARRGGALRTEGITRTWRYPDDPAVSLRHGPSGIPGGTPGHSNPWSTTGRRRVGASGLEDRLSSWSQVQIARLQLDFPNPENAEVFPCWVPFDEEIAVGWE
jgi:hypothetical protein